MDRNADLEVCNPCLLKRAGLKVTNQRLIVLDAFQQHCNSHLSAEQIFRYILKRDISVSLASIHRILGQFCETGLAIKHYFDESALIYELADHDAHGHIIDSETGDITEFNHPQWQQLKQEIEQTYDCHIVQDALVLYVRKNTSLQKKSQK